MRPFIPTRDDRAYGDTTGVLPEDVTRVRRIGERVLCRVQGEAEARRELYCRASREPEPDEKVEPPRRSLMFFLAAATIGFVVLGAWAIAALFE